MALDLAFTPSGRLTVVELVAEGNAALDGLADIESDGRLRVTGHGDGALVSASGYSSRSCVLNSPWRNWRRRLRANRFAT